MPDSRIETLRAQFYQSLGINENTPISEDQAAALIDQWEQFLFNNRSYIAPGWAAPQTPPMSIPAPTYAPTTWATPSFFPSSPSYAPSYTPASLPPGFQGGVPYYPPALPPAPLPPDAPPAPPPVYVQPPKVGSTVNNKPPGAGWLVTHQGYKDAVKGTDGKYYWRPDGKYPAGTVFVNRNKPAPPQQTGPTLYSPGITGQVWKP